MAPKLSVASRTRAAICHLAVFTVVGTFLLPFVMGFVDEEDPEFSTSHRHGALLYQLSGLVLFAALAAVSWVPGWFTDAFTAGAILAFYWTFYLLLLGIYLLGAVYLAVQAWSGQQFDFGPLNPLVHGEPSEG